MVEDYLIDARIKYTSNRDQIAMHFSSEVFCRPERPTQCQPRVRRPRLFVADADIM